MDSTFVSRGKAVVVVGRLTGDAFLFASRVFSVEGRHTFFPVLAADLEDMGRGVCVQGRLLSLALEALRLDTSVALDFRILVS